MLVILPGSKYGELTVLRELPTEKRIGGLRTVVCRCVCGSTLQLQIRRLGHKLSCGCLHNEPILVVPAGVVFGRLTVIKDLRAAPGTPRMAYCLCTCGTKLYVKYNNLATGNSKSCGCLNLDRIRERNTTHGLSSNPLYHHWRAMVERCRNDRHKSYAGRGIGVCEEWSSPAEIGAPRFIAWNESLPSHRQWREGLQLDRRDNDAGYSP